MYDLYKGYYAAMIPYLRMKKKNCALYTAEKIILKNANMNSYFDEYSKYIAEYKARYRAMNESEYDSDVENFKVLLVSNDINRIRKTAMILGDVASCGGYNDEDDVIYDDYSDSSGANGSEIVEIQLSSDSTDDHMVGNPYVVKTGKILEVTHPYETGGILFRGLEAGNLDEQCEAITSVSDLSIFVGIPEELLMLPQVQMLLLERGFDVVRLPDVKPEYYRRIADELTEYGGVDFESPELKELVIGAIIKKCGNLISEERISTALTMGRVRMKEGETVFKKEHFSDFIQLDAVDARTRLEKLTGLKNLKEAVREYIAVRNEMRRNPRAFIECRHLIFEGNPGGGKTMGAGLLSDILAAEGITNGTFIAACRKDIIGSYVGQTAPKVAKLFREAAGGVLFVDEAGFFLNSESGGYIDEAIKEFVRYMENCRDVTVIFAMYPGESERVLALDAGLPSRISATVRFEDYSESELADIFAGMLSDKGYRVARGVAAAAGKYLMEMKAKTRERFGNARDARRLTDAVIKAVAIRHEQEKRRDLKAAGPEKNVKAEGPEKSLKAVNSGKNLKTEVQEKNLKAADSENESMDLVRMEDLKYAIGRMNSENHNIRNNVVFGFVGETQRRTQNA